MKIMLNGKEAEIGEATSIASLLEKRGLKNKPLVAELNGTILQAGQFGAVLLNEGDRLEIVRLVGGG
jgi:sulfur carrier protein